MINFLNIANTISESAKEVIWPTKCAICNRENYLLCKQCLSKLNFIDIQKICSICGEPFGQIQCCNCINTKKTVKTDNRLFMCYSCTLMDEFSGRIITVYKDGGEIRLANVIAYFLYQYLPLFIKKNFEKWILTFIPASQSAIQKRGYDHCEIICKNLARLSGIKMIKCFQRPLHNDQRKLNKEQREKNMTNTFKMININLYKQINGNIIIIDDVYTTGATLNTASNILMKNSIKKIVCLTFARTF